MVTRLAIGTSAVARAVRISCALALALGAVLPSGAADYRVTKTTDDTGPCLPGDCSLRAAILAANSNPGEDHVYLGSGTFALTIAGVGENLALTGDLDITDVGTSTRIHGSGPGVTVVDAQGLDRVFHVLPGAHAIFQGLTITGGGHPAQGGDGGGGIWDEGLGSYIYSCEITGNSTGAAPDLYGGGVDYSGPGAGFTLSMSTVSDCSATGGGGGLAVRDASANSNLIFSTVVGNSAPYGGAVYVVGASHLDNATISGNFSSESSPGVFVLGEVQLREATLFQPLGIAILNGLQGHVELTNTAILGQCSALGTWVTNGGNLESSGDTCHLGSSDLTNVVTTQVEPLAWNGGPTMTHRFGAGSLAVDFPGAHPQGGGYDQRLLRRPQDGDGDGNPIRDVGAVEAAFGELVSHSFESGFTTGWSATSF